MVLFLQSTTRALQVLRKAHEAESQRLELLERDKKDARVQEKKLKKAVARGYEFVDDEAEPGAFR